MRPRAKILATLVSVAVIVARADFYNHDSGSAVNGATTVNPPEAGIDCPYLPSRHPLVTANPTRRWAEISKLTRQFAVQLPPVPFIMPEIRNFIDEHIFEKISKHGVPFAGLCSDEEFIRRVSLDLTGRLPSAAEVRAFVADPDPNKRDLLVDALIGSEPFVDRWTTFFGDLLRNVMISSNVNLYADGRNAYYKFIREAIRENRPYDQFVKELITATGDSFQNGESNFLVRELQGNGPIQDTFDNLAIATGKAFLGITLECISCHTGAGRTNTFNLWLASKERMDFWKMAAFFSRTRIQRRVVSQNPTVVKYIVSEASSGEYLLNTTSGNRKPRQPEPGQPNFVRPAFILNGEGPRQGEGYREALARLLTASPQFAKATVNYLWKHFFTIGIVEPADGFDLLRQDPNNPPPKPWSVQPTHPELLEQLAQTFVERGYDLQYMMKLITQSSAYQLSARFEGEWKDEYVPFFSRKFVRRLSAEEIHDAIAKATGIAGNYTVAGFDQPMQWAMQLPDTTEPRSNRAVRTFLDTFLRGDRDTRPRKQEASILQSLTLLNNGFVTSRVRATTRNSTVQTLLRTSWSNEELVEELFLATLSRFPTPEEKAMAVGYLSGGDRARRLEDLQLVLLNKVDFIFNY